MTISAKDYLDLKADDPFVLSESFVTIEDAFFTSLRTASGSWKTTRRHRLDRINDMFFEVLAPAAASPLLVMDIGISSGVTTIEWLVEFERRGFRVKMIGTDVSMTTYIVTLGRNLRVLVEPNGSILQLELFGRGIRLWCGWRDYFNGSFAVRRALARLAKRRLARLGIHFPINRVPLGPLELVISGPYRLVTPQLRARADVVLADDNILAATPPEYAGVADVIRAANVLQHSYFSDEQIRAAVRNIRARCRGEGSLVVICREKDGILEGSILRTTGAGFCVERRLGAGSEVESYFVNHGTKSQST